MLSNKDIRLEEGNLIINGDKYPIVQDVSELEGDVEALSETVGDETSGLVKAVDDLSDTVGDDTSGLVKDISDIDDRVTALEQGSGGGVGAWTMIADVDAADNSYTYIRNLKYKDKDIFAADTEAKEILVLLHSNANAYFAPPIIFPVSVMMQSNAPMYRSIDAWESTKKGFIATRDSAYTDSITTYQYNNGSNVKISVYVR